MCQHSRRRKKPRLEGIQAFLAKPVEQSQEELMSILLKRSPESVVQQTRIFQKPVRTPGFLRFHVSKDPRE
jgi:hypothetical protein